MPNSPSRYSLIIEKIFLDNYSPGDTEVLFHRDELETAASDLGIDLPKNLGDVIYNMRYRSSLPDTVKTTAPDSMEWIISGKGKSKYSFELVPINRIYPNESLVYVKIPDSTPEIISKYSLDDEQALLAKVRYNRLVDIFLGLSSYSLQNHLRTGVKGVGQIEIDEMYVGVDKQGRQFIIPVQAKGGDDQLSVVQTKQDIDCCLQNFPDLICRPLSVQFMDDGLIAMFELCLEDNFVRVLEEKHYMLVPADQISPDELNKYRSS